MSSKDAELSKSDFWDEWYKQAEGSNPTHEWFRTYDALVPFFQKNLFDVKKPEEAPCILHLGSGDSTIPYDLLARGYNNQVCPDFSLVVVDLMKSRHEEQSPYVKWQLADVRDMPEIASRSVDVAFDKGTLDAMIYGSPWSPPDDVLENTGKYMDEVFRVLKDDGVFLYITYRQTHFIRPLLNRNDIWDLNVQELGGGESSFAYFGWVLKKRQTAST